MSTTSTNNTTNEITSTVLYVSGGNHPEVCREIKSFDELMKHFKYVKIHAWSKMAYAINVGGKNVIKKSLDELNTQDDLIRMIDDAEKLSSIFSEYLHYTFDNMDNFAANSAMGETSNESSTGFSGIKDHFKRNHSSYTMGMAGAGVGLFTGGIGIAGLGSAVGVSGPVFFSTVGASMGKVIDDSI